MTKQEFIAVTKKSFKNYGFKLINSKLYLELEDIIVIITLQKSNFENKYYINYGYCFKKFWTKDELLKPYNCNDLAVDKRLLFNGKDFVLLDEISIIDYEKELPNILCEFFDPIKKYGIEYIKKQNHLIIAKPWIKEYLGIR